MKRKQIATLQIIAVLAICLFVFLTVLYQKGYYDFTFIERPSDNVDTDTATKNDILEWLTPTFEFGNGTESSRTPSVAPSKTTESHNSNSIPETDEEDEIISEDEMGDESETEEETLPPLVFDTETDPDTSESDPENTETAPDGTDTPEQTTDTPEQTTGDSDNTSTPEASESPEQTTGPEQTTATPDSADTPETTGNGTPEQQPETTIG